MATNVKRDSTTISGDYHSIKLPKCDTCQITNWSVTKGDNVQHGTLLCKYHTLSQPNKILLLKSTYVGRVHDIKFDIGYDVTKNTPVLEIEALCDHPTIINEMCGVCGANLRKFDFSFKEHGVAVLPGLPIRVSQEQARDIGREDKLRLLRQRKLALFVDLDQTLVHTSTDPNIPPRTLPDVYGFKLDNYPLLYHARLRPYVHEFLEKVSKLYEMTILTMGSRCYAHTLSKILDPERSEQVSKLYEIITSQQYTIYSYGIVLYAVS